MAIFFSKDVLTLQYTFSLDLYSNSLPKMIHKGRKMDGGGVLTTGSKHYTLMVMSQWAQLKSLSLILQLAKSMFHSITLNTSNCQFSPHRDKSFLPLQIRIDPGHYERYHTVAYYAWAQKWWHPYGNEFNIERC